MAITHTYPDGRTVEFVTETAKRMHVLDFEGKRANDDIVCQWCKHAFAFSKSPKCWRCGKYPDGKPFEVDESAPCEKFEDAGFGKEFSRDVLAETLPKDSQIRKSLIAQLRKEFGHAVAVIGDQIFHLGRMGVYASNIYNQWIQPIEPGNLGSHILDQIANESTAIRQVWYGEANQKTIRIDRDKIGIEEFKLMPFICYAPSQVKHRADGVDLGKKIGDRIHWARLTREGMCVHAEYLGSEEA